MPDRIETAVPELQAKLEQRRTGVVFLCLIVATNFVPWMQLAEAGIDSTVQLSAAQSSLAIFSCLVAALLVVVAWLLGRRLPVKSGPMISRARDVGLALALLATAANLALTLAVRRQAPGSSFTAELRWFGPVWYGLILPIGLVAGFFKGRASIPTLRPLGPPRPVSTP